MGMKDLYNNLAASSILDPIVVSATATYTDIDLQGCNSCLLLVSLGLDAGSGLSADNKLVFVLSDSDDGTTYTAVETADMIDLTVTSGVVITVDAVGEDNTLYKLGYVGGQRYLQLVATETGTVSVPMTIILIKGHPQDAPVA
jgi:hypothetical protein